VELATGVLTLLTVSLSFFTLKTSGLAIVYHLLVTYALITLFVSDLLYQTLPDEIIYPTLGLVFAWTLFKGDLLMALLAALAAVGFFLFLIVVTRGKGVGWGDVKLVGLMGLFLGFPGLVIALILAFLTGATTGVILVLLRKKRLVDQIAFGPFLASATWISFFWGQKIWQIYVEKVFL
jgi:prepilin signal peptidase PulO-like enzyme (type II secretory pathway)